MPATNVLLDIALALYYCIVVYRLIKLITSKHRNSSQWLDLCSHIAMVLFLSLTFQVIKSDQMDMKINLSTALAVLCSCLVSLVFGINIGRSWGPDTSLGSVSTSKVPQSTTAAVTPSAPERRRKGKSPDEDVFGSVDAALFHEAKRQNEMLHDNHQLVHTLEQAKSMLSQFWELKPSSEGPASLIDTQPKWKLTRTEHNSHVWVSKEKADGVMIRGAATLSSISPAAALRYILDHDCSTALEGITSKLEIVHTSPKDRIIVRKLYCNLGTLTSSKREFIVATSWAEVETQPGNFIIVSVSVPEDSYATRKGYIRASLHTSGYILSKRAALDGGGCQILFAVHMDLGGGSSRRLNAAKSDAIATTVLSQIYSMQNLSAPEIARLEVQRNFRRLSSQQPALQLAEISDQQRIELFSISQDAIRRLRVLYNSVIDVQLLPPAAGERNWVNFFDQNGVSISEYSGGTGQPIGTLQACCHVDASWDTVQNLLIDHPEKVDALLEGSTVLCDLDANTFVQWIAYGAIWPVGARDFLVVTQVDQLSDQGGFLIVSTSVDSVCEDLEIGRSDETDSASNDEEDSKYTRSTLKLAGYVGVPNAAKGGTDLYLFVDVDVASFVPSWLLQMLAQYGLSEIMTRIRSVASQETPTRISSNDGLSAPVTSPKRVPSNEGPSSLSAEDRNRKMCTAVAEESRSLLEIYLGRKKDPNGTLKLDWQSRAKKSGIEVFGSAVPGSAWNAIRATATMRAHRKSILALLVDDSKIGYYDDMFDSCEMIMRLDDCTSVRRIRFKAIWPTAPRDFVVLTTWTELPDGIILISSRSAPNTLYPKEAEVVRGNIQVSGYLIRPVDGPDGKICEVTLCAHSDLGGTLPVGIINMLSSAAPLKILSTISQLVSEA